MRHGRRRIAAASVVFVLIVMVVATAAISAWFRATDEERREAASESFTPARFERVWPIPFLFDEASVRDSSCGNDWEVSADSVRFRMEPTDPCASGSILGKTAQALPHALASAIAFRVNYSMEHDGAVSGPLLGAAVFGHAWMPACEDAVCDALTDSWRFMKLDEPEQGGVDWSVPPPQMLRKDMEEMTWSIATGQDLPADGAPFLPPSTNPGWTLDVMIDQARIEMREELKARSLPIGSTVAVGATVVDRLVVDVEVPVIGGGHRLEVMNLTSTTSPHSVIDPEGKRYAFPDVDQDEVYVVPAEFMEGGGTGTYRFVFERMQGTGSYVVPQMSAPGLAFLFLAIPVAASGLVLVSIHTYRKGRVAEEDDLLLVLRRRARATAATALVVVALVTASGAWRLLNVWPPESGGAALLSVLLMLSVVALAVWLRASHVLRHLFEDDAERERRLAREVDRRAREMEDFAYAVSHDLKTPLMAMKWLVRDLPEPKAKQARADFDSTVAQIRDNLEGMEAFIADLLEIAKVGDSAANNDPVELHEVADLMGSRLAPLVKEKKSRIEVADGMGTWRGDKTLYGQMLANLMGNALKYGCPEPGGTVRVRAERSAAEARLVVEDDGPGIEHRDKERIFEMFGRASGASTEPGTGLGLSLVAKIAHAYGGEVTVENVENGGARFVVSLPADRARLPDATPPSTGAPGPRGSPTPT